MHKPSGLLGVGIFSTSQTNDANPSAFLRRAGTRQDRLGRVVIDRNFFAPSPTAFWRGYGKVNDSLAKAAMQSRRHSRQRQPEAGTFVNIGTPVQITGSEVNRSFLALDQDFALRCVLHRRASLLLTNVPPFPGTAKTAPRGRLFLRASSLDTGICDRGATERPQSSDFLNFNRLLWGVTTRLKSHGLALILYTESRPCGLVRFRQA